MNDKVGIHDLSRNNHVRSNEQLRSGRLADNAHNEQSNNLWQTYTDGFVDYTHEI